MIRMGRSNKQEQPSETPQYQETFTNTSTANTYNSGRPEINMPSSRTGAVSESDSIGRDIKEGRLSGFVGYGTVLTGETSFQAMLRVDGHLKGSVTSENGTLIVGSNGRVDANIMVASASINGTINGDIIALEKVELGRTAQVMGNIQTPRLVIEDGAMFEGSCSMIKAKEVQEQRIVEANRAQYAAQQTEPTITSEADEEENVYSEAATN